MMRWTMWCLGIAGMLVMLVGCGQGCHEVKHYSYTGYPDQFGHSHILMEIEDKAVEECPTITDRGRDVLYDHSKAYYVGFRQHEIVEITQSMKYWADSMGGGRIFDHDLDGLNQVGEQLIRLYRRDGALQTWIFDPRHSPQVYALGPAFGQDLVARQTPLPIGRDGFRTWSGDTLLIVLSPYNESKMDSGVNYFYLQDRLTGAVRPLDFRGHDGRQWSDVIRYGDTIFTLSRSDSVTGYLHRYLQGHKDSLRLDLAASFVVERANDSGRGQLAFKAACMSRFYQPQDFQAQHCIRLDNIAGGSYVSDPFEVKQWESEPDWIERVGARLRYGDSVYVSYDDTLRQVYPNIDTWKSIVK